MCLSLTTWSTTTTISIITNSISKWFINTPTCTISTGRFTCISRISFLTSISSSPFTWWFCMKSCNSIIISRSITTKISTTGISRISYFPSIKNITRLSWNRCSYCSKISYYCIINSNRQAIFSFIINITSK